MTGGGLAGPRRAVELSDSKFHVTIFEAQAHPGGRTTFWSVPSIQGALPRKRLKTGIV
jgi:monoamine oxidase